MRTFEVIGNTQHETYKSMSYKKLIKKLKQTNNDSLFHKETPKENRKVTIIYKNKSNNHQIKEARL